ncbi:MAG: hypothetical protein ACUVQ8_02025 [Nitrososphaeria archaeon]
MSLFTAALIIIMMLFLLFAVRLRRLTLGIVAIILFLIAGIILRTISSLMEILSIVLALALLMLIVILKRKQ